MQWMMLQQDEPDDFVIATGEQFSVRDFVNETAQYLEMDIKWSGSGVEETGILNDKEIITINPRYFRPSEVETLLGDPSKAKKLLGWEPKISFKELVKDMVDSDLIDCKKELLIKGGEDA